MKRFIKVLLFIALVLPACSQPTPEIIKETVIVEITQPPLPTHTPYPTYTKPPVPTAAPKPTHTPTPALEAGATRVWEPDDSAMVYVPAGVFLMGDDKREVYLDEFWINRTPVTNAQYARFVAVTGHAAPKHWKGETPPQEISDHPVVYVSWHDAAAYAEWAGGRLPTEEEWEKAARGTDGREYPWGNEFDSSLCNSVESGIGATTPVGRYSPDGDSPYGVADMAGNVWEWTDSWWDEGQTKPVLRGGCSWNSERFVRSALRGGLNPDFGLLCYGFRVVVAPN